MIRALPLLAAACALTAGVAFAEPYGFEGVWARVDLGCAAQGDAVPTEITSEAFIFYESSCDIDRVTPFGTAGESWRIEASCAGEGEEWPASYILARHRQGGNDWLTMIDASDGFAWLHTACPLTDGGRAAAEVYAGSADGLRERHRAHHHPKLNNFDA